MRRRKTSTWTRNGVAFAALVVAGGTTFVALPVAVGAEESDPAATAVAQSFSSTGDVQTFTVPEGICGVTVDAYGAQGGTGTGAVAADQFIEGFLAQIPGGLGGRATAALAVTPGEVLTVMVGGEGGDGTASASVVADGIDPPSSDASANPGAGGFNGGGDGAAGTVQGTFEPNDFDQAAVAAATAAGGGGGASDVRQGGTGLEHRVVVAGGGGGGAGYGVFAFLSRAVDAGVGPLEVVTDFLDGGAGGAGGGTAGAAGAEGESSPGGSAGGGGTQTAGGAAGVGVDLLLATPGTLGQGGTGGGSGLGEGAWDPSVTAFISVGGGGGGGLYGGGGGTAPGALDMDVPPDTESGPGGGGGGSGFALGGTLTGDVHEGDGQIVISYDPVLDACPPMVSPKFTG